MGYQRDGEGGENGLNAELGKIFDGEISVSIDGLDDNEDQESSSPDYEKWEAELKKREEELAKREAALEAQKADAEKKAETGSAEQAGISVSAASVLPDRQESVPADDGVITLDSVALQVQTIYDDFTEAVQSLGGKGKKSSGKMKSGLMHMVAGSHFKGEREILCENFLTDVKKQLEMLSMYMEGAEESEIRSACTILIRIMTGPWPSKSNATTVLMKRAMIGQAEPYIRFVPSEVLQERIAAMKAEYGRFSMLPIEKQVLKTMSSYAGKA